MIVNGPTYDTLVSPERRWGQLSIARTQSCKDPFQEYAYLT